MCGARDGVEAVAFLRREGPYAHVARPDLILLDLNLPRKDGRAVLREIKADPILSLIPVVVLTTSPSEDDVLTSYGLHANCYILKPVELDHFMAVIRLIEEFWLTAVKLPNQHGLLQTR
jgi:chemotaxis family two-component system response regulator Rcp1